MYKGKMCARCSDPNVCVDVRKEKGSAGGEEKKKKRREGSGREWRRKEKGRKREGWEMKE